jgi:hypothetical protein
VHNHLYRERFLNKSKEVTPLYLLPEKTLSHKREKPHLLSKKTENTNRERYSTNAKWKRKHEKHGDNKKKR